MYLFTYLGEGLTMLFRLVSTPGLKGSSCLSLTSAGTPGGGHHRGCDRPADVTRRSGLQVGPVSRRAAYSSLGVSLRLWGQRLDPLLSTPLGTHRGGNEESSPNAEPGKGNSHCSSSLGPHSLPDAPVTDGPPSPDPWLSFAGWPQVFFYW